MVTVGRFHLTFDLTDIKTAILVDKGGLEGFIRKLAISIEMKFLYGPVVISGIMENPGLTGFAVVDFSHISIHTFTDSNKAYVDIFSCKEFDKESAKIAVLSYFQATDLQMKTNQVSWQ